MENSCQGRFPLRCIDGNLGMRYGNFTLVNFQLSPLNDILIAWFCFSLRRRNLDIIHLLIVNRYKTGISWKSCTLKKRISLLFWMAKYNSTHALSYRRNSHFSAKKSIFQKYCFIAIQSDIYKCCCSSSQRNFWGKHVIKYSSISQ